MLRKSTMNPCSPPVLTHLQPYTMALKGTPPLLIQNHFQSAHPVPSDANCESQYSAFIPPTRTNDGLSSTTIVVSPPSVHSASILPSSTTSSSNNGVNFHAAASSSSLNEMAQLQHVNMQLTDKVRQWEAWYMTIRHELEARNEAQARANYLQSQVEELQRQKAVLAARVGRWQGWAKNVNKAAARKKNTQHHEEKLIVSDEATLLPRLAANPPKDHGGKSRERIELQPRPFKKRRFQATMHDDERGDAAASLPSSQGVTGAAVRKSKKSSHPRPILKVRTLEASTKRCLTPQESLATTPAPVTPSEEDEASRRSVEV